MAAANASFKLEMAEARKAAQSQILGAGFDGGGRASVRLEQRRGSNGQLAWSISFRLGAKMLCQMTASVAQATFSIRTMSEAVAKYNELLQAASRVPTSVGRLNWAELVQSLTGPARTGAPDEGL